MFKEELAALKDIYLTRFNLVHVLSREAQDIELLHGRIDARKAEALMTHWLDLDRVDAVFVCGPDGMMQAVAEALKARGYPDAKVRIERFATSVPRHEHRPSKPVEPGHSECEVTVVLEGVTARSRWKRARKNILEAGLRTASSCHTPARAASARRAGRSSPPARSTWTSTSRWRTTKWHAASCSRARAIP
jgi:ring-1,2-phenylacetyl-CoA epoxidase subunit PaaE